MLESSINEQGLFSVTRPSHELISNALGCQIFQEHSFRADHSFLFFYKKPIKNQLVIGPTIPNLFSPFGTYNLNLLEVLKKKRNLNSNVHRYEPLNPIHTAL